MLGWVRAKSRTLAAAVFVLLSAATVANHGASGHDDHGTALVVHDAAAHAFTDGTASPRGEAMHCVLCHLTRTVRPAVEVAHHAPTYGALTLPAPPARARRPSRFPGRRTPAPLAARLPLTRAPRAAASKPSGPRCLCARVVVVWLVGGDP